VFEKRCGKAKGLRGEVSSAHEGGGVSVRCSQVLCASSRHHSCHVVDSRGRKCDFKKYRCKAKVQLKGGQSEALGDDLPRRCLASSRISRAWVLTSFIFSHRFLLCTASGGLWRLWQPLAPWFRCPLATRTLSISKGGIPLPWSSTFFRQAVRIVSAERIIIYLPT